MKMARLVQDARKYTVTQIQQCVSRKASQQAQTMDSCGGWATTIDHIGFQS